MPWITDAELKTELAGALGLAASSSLPTHFSSILVTTANSRAYTKVRGVLMGRGFTAAQLDAWEARTDWNKRLGVLAAFIHAAKRGEKYETSNLLQEWKEALEELMTETIVIADEPVYPTGDNGRVSTGDYDTSSDRFTLDEPDGSGDFSVGDGTRL